MYKEIGYRQRIPHGGFKALNSVNIALYKIFWYYQLRITNIHCVFVEGTRTGSRLLALIKESRTLVINELVILF